MSIATQKQSLLDAVGQLRVAEQLLLEQSRSMSDAAKLIQVTNEYNHLDSYLSQILHAQALADDQAFSAAATALKNQVTSLALDESAIKKIVADVATAGRIVGCIAKAITIIGTL